MSTKDDTDFERAWAEDNRLRELDANPMGLDTLKAFARIWYYEGKKQARLDSE